MGDDIPKTYEWGKMKLPSYDFGDITEEEVSTPDQSPETSQESTRPAKEEDK
jgi:hypothetical protein